MFLTSCLQINKGTHFLYYGNYSGVFDALESRKTMTTLARNRKKAIEQFFILRHLYFLVSPLVWKKSNYTPSPLSYPPRCFSFYKQVQTRFKETDTHMIKPKLKLILAILAIENVDHLRCTICIPGVSWIVLIKRLTWILKKNSSLYRVNSLARQPLIR